MLFRKIAMQEYEDVESSQIYIPDSDETQIVDNENETVSRCDILPHLAQTLSASCKKCAECTPLIHFTE